MFGRRFCFSSWQPLILAFEQAHEIMVLFVLRKLFLQTHMRARCRIFVRPFVYFHTSCVRTAKALGRLRGCAGLPESLLIAYVLMSWLILTLLLWQNMAWGLTYFDQFIKKKKKKKKNDCKSSVQCAFT